MKNGAVKLQILLQFFNNLFHLYFDLYSLGYIKKKIVYNCSLIVALNTIDGAVSIFNATPLFMDADIFFSKKDVISAADSRYECPVCFYNVLADYFVCTPQNGKSILDLIVQLWSQLFVSSIFTLLFHKWVCIFFRTDKGSPT